MNKKKILNYTTQIPVTMGALLKRINRKLAYNNEFMRTSRGIRSIQELGDFYILNISHNCVLFKDVDPVELAKELGVLKPFENVIMPE